LTLREKCGVVRELVEGQGRVLGVVFEKYVICEREKM
jgi:hypothetical protein